jgi:hypothetical protein
MIKQATHKTAILAASADREVGYTAWLSPIRVNTTGSPVAAYRLMMRNMYFRKCKTQGGGYLWK